MKQIFSLCVLLLFFSFAFSFEARAEREVLSLDVAQDNIDITAGFNGTNIIVYGVKYISGRVAVTLSGPRKDMVVRKKKKIAGVWMNKHSEIYENIPSYYAFALDGGEATLAKEAILEDLEVGFSFLQAEKGVKMENSSNREGFQKALVRNKQKQRLFPASAGEVSYIDDRLFKVHFYMPANVPTGLYNVRVILFDDAGLVAKKETSVRVAPVGISFQIKKLSRSYPFFYGVLCVLVAIGMGWLSNSLKKKA